MNWFFITFSFPSMHTVALCIILQVTVAPQACIKQKPTYRKGALGDKLSKIGLADEEYLYYTHTHHYPSSPVFK